MTVNHPHRGSETVSCLSGVLTDEIVGGDMVCTLKKNIGLLHLFVEEQTSPVVSKPCGRN